MIAGDDRTDPRPVSGLLTDLVHQMTSLFRTEISLLKSETKDNFRAIGAALITVVVGAAFVLAALIVLVQAVVAGLVSAGLSVWVASLIVGVVLAVVGGVMVKKGADNLSPAGMTPDRTVRQMEKDVNLVKETAK